FGEYLEADIQSNHRNAPVAQRIEHRPPEPSAQVRVLSGALIVEDAPVNSWCVFVYRSRSSPRTCNQSRGSNIGTKTVTGMPKRPGSSASQSPPGNRPIP